MIKIDPKLFGAGRTVLDLLSNAGFQAYVVGGHVRNALLGAPVSDLDIATNASPAQVIGCAKSAGIKAVPTGIDHGTVTLVIKRDPIEVTTFRRDVATDGRRAVVSFANTIEEDARRRDFTMNALYADLNGTVFDPLGGLADLMTRRVRFIDDPAQRICEDYLRILRFFRFFAWYGDRSHGFDSEALAACATHSAGLSQLSKERVGGEMLKLLGAPDPSQAVAVMEQSGVLSQILPGAQAKALAVLIHLEDGLTPDPLRRLAALGGKDLTEAMRLSKAEARYLTGLQSGIETNMPPHEAGYRLGANIARDLILLRAALFENILDHADLLAVAKGASAKFPMKAEDLPELSGAALGQALKSAQTAWIASGFVLTLPELIAKCRP